MFDELQVNLEILVLKAFVMGLKFSYILILTAKVDAISSHNYLYIRQTFLQISERLFILKT